MIDSNLQREHLKPGENEFFEVYKLLVGSFDDVIDSVIDTIDGISMNNEDIGRLEEKQNALDNLEQCGKKLTDLYLDEGISKETYDEKYEELTVKIKNSKESIAILQENVPNQKDVRKRMATTVLFRIQRNGLKGR